jgi:hypothetical protein
MFVISPPPTSFSLKRLSRTWEDSNRTELVEMGCGVLDWIQLAQDSIQWQALVKTVINIRVPEKEWDFSTN